MTAAFPNGSSLARLAGCCILAVALSWPAGAARGAPRERIELSISGVDDAIAENVRAYLTLTRYATRDDLTDPQVRRLAAGQRLILLDYFRPWTLR